MTNPNDCEHIRVETLYQYDAQKNRTVFWACPECHMLFQPKGLADAELTEDNRALMEAIKSAHLHLLASICECGELLKETDAFDVLDSLLTEKDEYVDCPKAIGKPRWCKCHGFQYPPLETPVSDVPITPRKDE